MRRIGVVWERYEVSTWASGRQAPLKHHMTSNTTGLCGVVRIWTTPRDIRSKIDGLVRIGFTLHYIYHWEILNSSSPAFESLREDASLYDFSVSCIAARAMTAAEIAFARISWAWVRVSRQDALVVVAISGSSNSVAAVGDALFSSAAELRASTVRT